MTGAESLQAGAVCLKVDPFTQELDVEPSFARGTPWITKFNASVIDCMASFSHRDSTSNDPG